MSTLSPTAPDGSHSQGANPADPGPSLLDHTSDGIEEYDNPLPFWWTWIMWASVVFSALYFFYYQGGGQGQSIHAEYEADLGEFYAEQAARMGNLQGDDATIAGLLSEPKKLLAGRALFKANCAACHASDGGGGTGPNLCDGTYINIQKPSDVFKVISSGVLAKGMPEWKTRFNQTQLVLLAGYVAELRGTTPAAPRPAQGTFNPPAWSSFAAAPPPTTPKP